MHQPYRLAIDLGTNSLGWCVLDLKRRGDDRAKPNYEPFGIRRMGVRIFPDGRDPQSGASLAAARRLPRGQRRRRDRFLQRQHSLLVALVELGLMPSEPMARKALEKEDPYGLRALALDQSIPLHHLGRALFHMNQRRGFKSNRRTERGSETGNAKEVEGIAAGSQELARRINETMCRTLGEYLWKSARAPKPDGTRRSERGAHDGTAIPYGSVRARSRIVKGRAEYDIYPTRELYEAEFDRIWEAQANHHPELTTTARDQIRHIMFHQRPLKPVDPGKCTFNSDEQRAPLALPLAQEFRILQELANLEFEHDDGRRRRLSLPERDALHAKLRVKPNLKFERVRTMLKLDSGWRINLQEVGRKELKGDSIGATLSGKTCFGNRWWADRSEAGDAWRADVATTLLDEEDDSRLARIAVEEWGLTPEQANAVVKCRMVDGYGRLGITALKKIVTELRAADTDADRPITYDEAALRAGYRHSLPGTGEVFDELPYYGAILDRFTAPVASPSAPDDERTYGKLANPTVHVGLNQVRLVVNALIKRYGPPAEIIVELARELKMNAEQRENLKKQQFDNRKGNERRRAEIAEIERSHGLQLRAGDALLRMRLWEELGNDPLDRECIYTGRRISGRMLFSSEVDIDHILPFKRFLDDSPANLTVSLRRANRFKGNRTPYEAFHGNPADGGTTYDWQGISLRAQALPPNKRWRFREDAPEMVREKAKRALLKERGELPKEVLQEIEDGSEFIARQLTDTAYLARLARRYLLAICNHDPNRVRVISGGLTGLLRRNWGLNALLYGNRPAPDEEVDDRKRKKRRDDHRHHALDAAVIGVTTISMLKRVSDSADQASRDRLIQDLKFPWSTFQDDLKARLDTLNISYKPEHSRSGELHEANPYGFVPSPEADEIGNLVRRKTIEDLSPNDISNVRDKHLRQKLKEHLGPLLFDKTELEAAKSGLKQARKAKNNAEIDRLRELIDGLKKAKKVAQEKGERARSDALTEFGHNHGIRHIRVGKVKSDVITVRNTSGCAYKALIPGDNYCVEIFQVSDGNWNGEGITLFQANQPTHKPSWRTDYPNASLVMRVHRGDMLVLDYEGAERLLRVNKLKSGNGLFELVDPRASGNLQQRHDDPNDSFRFVFVTFRQLKELRARKVAVDPLGYLRDPGPPEL